MCGHKESPIHQAFQLLPSDMITTADVGGQGIPTPRPRDAAMQNLSAGQCEWAERFE
jgi:hypothetical protein